MTGDRFQGNRKHKATHHRHIPLLQRGHFGRLPELVGDALPSGSAGTWVLRNVCSTQTLSVGDYLAPWLRHRDPVHRSGPGESSPFFFLKTNVYNHLGASVEGQQETPAYVCLRLEDCG